MKPAKDITIIITGIIVTTITLARFSDFTEHLLNIDYDWRFELSMVIGQLVFQGIFILRKGIIVLLQYYAKLMLVSLCGSLMLLPIIALNCIYPADDLLTRGWFFSVVLVMFFDCWRTLRCLAWQSKSA